MTTPADPHAPRLLTCDVLYTGMGGAQSPGAVVVVGRTVAATGHPDALRAAYPHATHAGHHAVIAPPPVNAHTHLDMSTYEFQALPYFRWLPEVVIAQRDRRGAPAAQAGAQTLAALGAGGVGDIVYMHTPDVMDTLLAREDLQGVLYYEALGALPERADETFRLVRERLDRWRTLERPGGPRVGLSPHTPYTVSHRLMRLLTEYAAGEGLPVQIHVAEHPAELELFATGGGPLWTHRLPVYYPATFESVIGRPPEPELTPVRYLDDLGALRGAPTLVHVVNVTRNDIARVARAGSAVVTCPRSNHHLECGVFPWAAFAAAGVEVAVGTDSVASGGSLDVRDEVAFARTVHERLDPRVVVRAAVKGGHRVLGTRAPFIRRGEAWSDTYLW
ncbi:amidohydrolase family protein [Deinococcus taeanensis]|uniref:amidohydrolase family protein n=1 Tax=Deinococcus taeanensis TaxID=2737050 RepID=UPI001CDCD899|nr:amidohydrolase family protein [Deinococcus taeanensis]UBV41553.1 amidohydrolase family protein [Deinococcus taeanensis]